MSIPSRRLALATLGLIGVMLAPPVDAQTKTGIVQMDDLILIGYPDEPTPMTKRVIGSGLIAVGNGAIDVVGLTFEQLDERLRRGGLILYSVMRRIEGPGPRSYYDVFRLGQKPRRIEWPPPIQRDLVPACPNCG